jgi:hypothetical protein
MGVENEGGSRKIGVSVSGKNVGMRQPPHET